MEVIIQIHFVHMTTLPVLLMNLDYVMSREYSMCQRTVSLKKSNILSNRNTEMIMKIKC